MGPRRPWVQNPVFLAATHLILHLLPVCFFTFCDFCIFIRFYLINLSNFHRFLLKKKVLFKMWRPFSKWSVWSKTGWRRIFYLTYIFTNLKVLHILAAFKKISKGIWPKNRQFSSNSLGGPRIRKLHRSKCNRNVDEIHRSPNNYVEVCLNIALGSQKHLSPPSPKQRSLI